MTTLSERLAAKIRLERPDWKPAANSKVKAAFAARGVSQSYELDRILKLPRRTLAPLDLPDLTPLYLRAARCGPVDPVTGVPGAGCDLCTPTKRTCRPAGCERCTLGEAHLWPHQNAVLLEASVANGAVVALGVGYGKTMLALLLADALQSKRCVIMVRPQLRDQLRSMMATYLRHFRVPVDRIHVVAYSEISTIRKADILDRIDPDLVVADEAQALRHRSSARTKRVMRFLKEHPACRFVPMSGSLTTRSLKDHAHLVEAALKKNSPMPAGWNDLNEWADAIDVPAKDKEPMAPGALLSLCAPGEDVRAGYRRRFVETPGVVASEEGALGAALVVARRSVQVPTSVLARIAEVDRLWEIAGEELEDGMAVARVMRQLSCGFYYVWDWTFGGRLPDGEPDVEWLAARAAWHKEIRDYLKAAARPGMDQPLQLKNAAVRFRDGKKHAAGAPVWASRTWPDWDAVRHRPEPPTIPVWIDDFLIEDAMVWGDSCGAIPHSVAERQGVEDVGLRGIVWYEHAAVGERLARASGWPIFAGGDNAAILATTAPVIVVSRNAHGDGKNMQDRYSRNLVLSVPSNGTNLEQMLGRTHRPGQRADEVACDVYLHTPALESALAAAVADARYQEQTMGQWQKILHCDRVGW